MESYAVAFIQNYYGVASRVATHVELLLTYLRRSPMTSYGVVFIKPCYGVGR
jgi:hypothetical protein